MIELKFLSDGVASVGLLWLRLFGRAIPFVNAVKNALAKKFITLFHYTKAVVYMTLAILLRCASNVIMTLRRVLFRK